MTGSNNKEKIRDFFDNAAIQRNLRIRMDPIVEYEHRVRSRMVVFMVDAKPNELILDVGCGNARDLIQIAKKGARCIGIDLSPKMIQEARKELLKHGISNVRLEIGDATELVFPDKMFDKVYASEVLEHISNYARAISEMARVLRPGGYLVVTTPNRRSLYGFDRYVIGEKLIRRKSRHPYDAWKTFDELTSALDDNGLKINSFSGVCYMPGSIISYRLPKIMKKLLVIVVGKLEPWLSKIFPKNGYLLAIKAIKNKNVFNQV